MAAPHPNHAREAGKVSAADRRTAKELLSLLGARESRDRFELRDEDGRVASLSAPMVSLIERAAQMVAQGTAVDVLARDKELTSQQAAEVLGVSRQYLVRLLDRGKIAFTRTGNHRRVRSADLVTYLDQRDTGRREALAAIAGEAQLTGAYEGPVELGPART